MTDNKSELQTSLDDVSNAITQFSAVEAGLAELRGKYEKVIFPVETADGLRDAKEARLAIREPRYNVERIRKDAKAPILELGRRLDTKAKQITDALLALEEPIDMAIKQEEGRKERERQAKIEAEERRVKDILDRIAAVRGAVTSVTAIVLPTSAKIAEFIAQIEAVVIDDSFAEFRQQADDARTATLATLRQIQTSAIEREKEQERIKAERAELAKLRAQQAEREAKDRAEREAAEAKARAEREAAEAQARAEREERERQEREALAEQRRQQAEEQARIDAENHRLAEERAAFEREQAEQRRRADEAERQRLAEAEVERKRKEAAERAARRAKFPGEQAIVDALCAHFEVQQEVVMKWLGELRKKAA